MQYFGGKSKIAKDVVKIIELYRKDSHPYLEPFIGGGSVMSLIDGERYGCDKHFYLIEMYKKLQDGWIPPKELTKEEYEYIKNNKDEQPYLTGFVGFGCSFAGKWFGGYAKNARGDNYCLNSHNAILKKVNNMKDVKFKCADYRDLSPVKFIIYCDPPYKGTTQYGAIVGEFDSDEFWNIMRKWSSNNIVLISEYNAPDDFVEIWRKETKTEIRNKDNKREYRVEKLFIHKSKVINHS